MKTLTPEQCERTFATPSHDSGAYRKVWLLDDVVIKRGDQGNEAEWRGYQHFLSLTEGQHALTTADGRHYRVPHMERLVVGGEATIVAERVEPTTRNCTCTPLGTAHATGCNCYEITEGLAAGGLIGRYFSPVYAWCRPCKSRACVAHGERFFVTHGFTDCHPDNLWWDGTADVLIDLQRFDESW